MQRTKIVCTIGPASNSPDVMRGLMRAGMDAGRINFSHGDYATHAQSIATLRQVAEEEGRLIAIIADLQGPKLRVGRIEGVVIELRERDEVTLTSHLRPGATDEIPVPHPQLLRDLRPGQTVLLDDGRLELVVVRAGEGNLKCRVVAGGQLTSHKGINVPGATLNLSALTPKDREDALFALEQGVDFFALSFVRRPTDVCELRQLLKSRGASVSIIAKIEKPEALSVFDEILAETYARVGGQPGLLENLAGIKERRWWPEGYLFTDAAAAAGAKAIEASGIRADEIGLLIDTSVCRDRLEPSSSVTVHHALDLPSWCLSFDLSNACLGFVSALQVAGNMIDTGQIDYALIVDGEGSRQLQQNTLDRLAGPDGIARADTSHHALCVGDLHQMRTDTKSLLDAGLQVSKLGWADAEEMGWLDADRYIIHQVSQVHTRMLCEYLGIDTARVPLTFPRLGNIGPASIPITLSMEAESLEPGDSVLLLGIGSGINASAIELIW